MKKITTRVHGILDYSTALLMIALPWLLNFQQDSVARNVTVATGALILLISLFTNYEAGALKLIPMRVHLGMDVFIALFTIISPWAYGFADSVYVPHLIIGAAELIIGLMSESIPFHHKNISASPLRKHAHE